MRMTSVMRTLQIASAVCASSLLVACAIEPAESESESESVGTATQAVAGDTTRIWFASDIITPKTGSSGSQCKAAADQTKAAATASLIPKNSPEFIALTEANNCSGTLDQYNNIFDQVWGVGAGFQKSRFKPVPGNHDYMTGSLQGFISYFNRSITYNTWSYMPLASWKVIGLDSNPGRNPQDQAAALERELASNEQQGPAKRTCVMAYFHHPVFSNGNKHYNEDKTTQKSYWDILKKYKADLVLVGHEHNYERFQSIDGIVQIVAGTGGAALNGFLASSHQKYDNRSVKRYSDKHGVLRITLTEGTTYPNISNPGKYRVEFVGTDGTVLDDTGDITCHE